MPDEVSEQGTVRYIRCPACGAPNPGSAPKCSRCGHPMQAKEVAETARPAPAQPAAQIVCAKCRKPLPPGSKFCGFCGAPLVAPAPAAPKPADQHVTPTEPIIPAVTPKAAPPAPKAPTPPSPPARPVVAKPPVPVPVSPAPRPPARPAPAAAPTPPVGEGTQVFSGLRVPKIEASITEVKPDGSTGKTTRILKETSIGRTNCDVTHPNDLLLSPRHASLAIRTGKLFLKDLGSQNGTFIKQRQDAELMPGDVFLLGRELFRFNTQTMEESPGQASPEGTQPLMGAPKLQRGPVTAKLERIHLTGEVIEEFKLDKSETTLGRTKGDLVFKDDPYMSGTHARITAQPGRFLLQDLKSRNGIYRRIRGEVELREGDEFFLGEKLFRVEIKVT